MKLTIESTTKMVILETPTGIVPARIWEGHTDTGIPVHCYITRVAVHEDLCKNIDVVRQFETELVEQRKPSSSLDVIPLRMIL
jgi:hypothetical protein